MAFGLHDIGLHTLVALEVMHMVVQGFLKAYYITTGTPKNDIL